MPSVSMRTNIQKSTGDRAVTGLLQGMLAGMIMLAYLLIVGLFIGVGPVELLSAFNPDIAYDPGEQAAPIQGFLLHLGISGVYGAVFGVLIGWRPRVVPQWLLGILYGALLLLLARSIILPAGGLGFLEISSVHFIAAHFLYGMVLGLMK
jgi:hypothetical protein